MSKLIRYCSECGTIGAVSKLKKGCCPGWAAAVLVPPNVAVQARAGFHAALALYEGKRKVAGQ